MKIGLYFGSFNPIHLGHLIVANTMIEQIGFDEVWLVISPQNPLKNSNALAPEEHRRTMTEMAVSDHEGIVASDIEFDLPRPSYTINTLEVLLERYSDHAFSLIMGKDNLVHFHKWKAYEDILEKVDIQVYDRRINSQLPAAFRDHPRIHIHKFPQVNISSTMLRKKLADGESIKYWVRDEVDDYIRKNGIYR